MRRRRTGVQLTPSSSTVHGRVDWAGLGDDAVGEVQLFAGASDARMVAERLAAEVNREVEAILSAVQDCDGFDLIELLRLRELPVVPVAALREGYDGNGAVIELVALILLSRGSRKPPDQGGRSRQPHEVVPELHRRATRLLRLATYASAARASVGTVDLLARLASEYQSYLISVRGLQYDSVQAEHDRSLFDRQELDDLLKRKLGFTYRDFVRVRGSIQDRYSRILTGLRDTTGDLVVRADSEDREPTEAELLAFRTAMTSFMFLPGDRASFTSANIADESGLDQTLVESTLQVFSSSFDEERDAGADVMGFLRGVNPLARTSLIGDADGNYVMTSVQIGSDSFRVVAEKALKADSGAWRRYNGIRASVSEALTTGALERLLQTTASHTNLKYIAPKESQNIGALASDCEAPYLVGDQTECDALFLIEDVAICVEVKGRTIADPARRGDLARLRNEIGETFGGGAEQARRLEALIEVNHGLWLETGEWLDLRRIREVRSVVIGLDFYGPLAVALGDLDRAGLLPQGRLPWIASLHDLDVISQVLDRPAEFLLYLRRRSDSGVATYYRGADELDLFMLFLDGGLYVEPDPDEIRRQYPNAGPSTNRARRTHEQDSRPTIVGTHTDQLDAWMYQLEGTSPFEVEKPSFNTHTSAGRIADFLAEGRKPGWFRFGSDLLGLSGEAQKGLAEAMQELVRRTVNDDRWHSLVQGYAGLWGYPTFFAATCPRSHTRREAIEKLCSYMAAKKHQVGSDRALGLLLDLSGNIIYVNYMNARPEADEELDDLGVAIGLASAGYSSPPIPPSARRATKRLRGKRSQKKRRK